MAVAGLIPVLGKWRGTPTLAPLAILGAGAPPIIGPAPPSTPSPTRPRSLHAAGVCPGARPSMMCHFGSLAEEEAPPMGESSVAARDYDDSIMTPSEGPPARGRQIK